MTHQLSIIIPTLNEVGNIEILIKRITQALSKIKWEIIFVDDNSSDGSKELLKKLVSQHKNIRAIHRTNKTGLSSACIEGIHIANSPILAIMDADLQHDEKLLPKMLNLLQTNLDTDIIIASRFQKQSSIDNFSLPRKLISHTGNYIARKTINADLSDPLSGFFMLNASVFHNIHQKLYGKGFKILLDIFATSKKPLNFIEIPLKFGIRHSGESKLNSTIALEFLSLICYKLLGKKIPISFYLFCFVGLIGVGVHMLVLFILFQASQLPFLWSQSTATFVAMTSNYFLNNSITFQDKRLFGKKLLTGLLRFYLICSVGALLNITFSGFLFGIGMPWYLAGFCGTLISAIWNFKLSSIFTWKIRN